MLESKLTEQSVIHASLKEFSLFPHDVAFRFTSNHHVRVMWWHGAGTTPAGVRRSTQDKEGSHCGP
jgi:hypothetical protein